MALKPKFEINKSDISKALDVVAERGVVCVHQTSGSGMAFGEEAGTATVADNPSGEIVAGLLWNDVYSLDETRYHPNFYINQVRVGDQSELVLDGFVVTNKVIGTPTEGQTAYLSSSGNVTPTLHADGGLVATPKVGKFGSILDEDGYVKLELNLPVV